MSLEDLEVQPINAWTWNANMGADAPRDAYPLMKIICEEAICAVLQQVGLQIFGLRHHGPNQNLTRCSARALNGFNEDIAPGVEDPPLKVPGNQLA